MLFLRLNNIKADHYNFHGFFLIVARWLLRHQSSCLHSSKGEVGRERGSTYMRKIKDYTETMERDFSYVSWPELCQMVASGLRELEKQGLGMGLDQR